MQKSVRQFPRLILFTLIIILIAISGLVYWLIRPEPDPFAGDAIVDPPFESLTYSIQTFLWWDEGQAGTHLDWVNFLINFQYIKQTFPWRDLEPRQGEWDFTQADRIMDATEERGMRVIARLGQVPAWAISADEAAFLSDEEHDSPPSDLSTWANYCGTVAERYQGRIYAYQIWNEPNLSREWGNQAPDAKGYVELLVACSEAIRAVDPDAVLISAGLAPNGQDDALAQRDDVYLDTMYKHNFQQYVDAVGVHAPGFAPPHIGPDDAVANGNGRWQSFRRVEDLRKIMIANGDSARQMAILEFGWTTDPNNPVYSYFAVSEELQAQYTREAFEYAVEHWRPWVGLMSLIYMPDVNWTENDEEYWWAVTTPDGRFREVFHMLIGLPKHCGDKVVYGWLPGWTEEEYREQRSTCY